uniref:uncharacterized protein LOC100182221 isoform X3 n=1 Tax=Ciona intestinalis TaxID=7719 RepID=UPI00089DABBA|nr:uncharacterized protein LOC100182221 isoform X3 [Ciona intestinalis]|eukprot:XP_018670209.1 uncharacterized protein LOC100182221 isoform X3 [Ciona intestinalis]
MEYMTYKVLDETICGMQVCQHPVCWATNQKITREMNKAKLDPYSAMRKMKTVSSRPSSAKEEEPDLPVLTILNLLDEYGYDPRDRFSPSREDQKMKNIPPEGVSALPKLTLESLARNASDDFTPAPANTPMHSAHGFGDSSTYSSNDLGSHMRGKTQPHPSRKWCNKIDLDLLPEFEPVKSKTVYVWGPRNERPTTEGSPTMQSKTKVRHTLSHVSLPIDKVPKNNSMKAIKGRKTISKQRRQIEMKNFKFTPVDGNDTKLTNETPSEIDQLRSVPLDVLIRIMQQAIENNLLTSKQAGLLLQQVVGPQYKVPPHFVQDITKQTKGSQTALFETRNMKIEEAQDARNRTSQALPTASPVYQLDGPKTPIGNYKSVSRNLQYSNMQISGVSPLKSPSKLAPIETREPGSRGQEVNVQDAKKGVPCITGGGTQETHPVKPFYYPRSPRDMCLRPLPTPPPPSPSTERDSQYDVIMGGSTVLVNPSGPPTLSSARSTVKRSRGVKLKSGDESESSNGGGKNTGRNVPWPQVDETDFMSDASEPIAGNTAPQQQQHVLSPLTEIPVSKPASSRSSRSHQASVDKLDQHRALYSPAPPPPSPEVPPLHLRDVIEGESPTPEPRVDITRVATGNRAEDLVISGTTIPGVLKSSSEQKRNK